MLRLIAATGLMALAAPLVSAEPQPPPVANGAEIIVEGRGTPDRYRLPVETRTASPADAVRAPAAADPRMACHSVGAYGCGTDVLPILTFRSDGSTHIGATPEGR
jgi:dienelactone hydrolase